MRETETETVKRILLDSILRETQIESQVTRKTRVSKKKLKGERRRDFQCSMCTTM